MMDRQLTKEQQSCLKFFARLRKDDRTTVLRIMEAIAERTGQVREDPDAIHSSEGVIHIDGERAERFHSILADVTDAATSLRTAAKLFPNDAVIHEGQMHPNTTILAFSMMLDDLIGDLMAMACGDDFKHRKEVGHAQD